MYTDNTYRADLAKTTLIPNDSLFYYKGYLCIFINITFYYKILESKYNTRVVSYIGADKTIELVRYNF